jgi:choline dehydrogenase-like flavoprotein
MEIDLQSAESRSEPFRAQVCIVGAGIAGLALAHKLKQQGIDVALLEAGGRSLTADSEERFAAAQLTRQRHNGTAEGRFRVFGGSSLRWGGQLLPFPADAVWPISQKDLAPFTAEAERLLGVDDLPFQAEEFFSQRHKPVPSILSSLPGIEASLSKWIPFPQRNLAGTLGRSLLSSKQVSVYLNAQATELILSPDRTRIEAVLAKDPAGRSFRFEATQIVVAAGTVETSRLLLASRSVMEEGIGNANGQVGRNFHDHLTLPIATLRSTARAQMLAELRPWTIGVSVHSAKLSASSELREHLKLNPVLAHLTIEDPEDSGVHALRQMLLASQRGVSYFGNMFKIPSALLEALKLAWSARIHRRRFVSPKAHVQIYLNVAQDAPSLSRITLSSQLDPSGMPQAAVDWRITDNELATLRNFAAYLRHHLESLHLSEGIVWNSDLFRPNVPLRGLDDARHAMGGACMGDDPRSSVVDANLRVHGVANLSIASAAVFPDGTPQLPTLPLVALTMRLADRLVAELRT